MVCSDVLSRPGVLVVVPLSKERNPSSTRTVHTDYSSWVTDVSGLPSPFTCTHILLLLKKTSYVNTTIMGNSTVVFKDLCVLYFIVFDIIGVYWGFLI